MRQPLSCDGDGSPCADEPLCFISVCPAQRGRQYQTGLVVLWNVTLTVTWVACSRHDAHELHHASIFVGEDVAVENVSAKEVQIGLPDSHSARCDIGNLAGRICADHPGRNRDHVLPGEVVPRYILRVLFPPSRGVDPDYLKWVNVDMERVGRTSPILKHPILQRVQRHALVNDLAMLAELFVINHEMGRESITVQPYSAPASLPLE